MKTVGVVILNYKVAKLAIRCVESVRLSSYKQIKIYLVDNNSNDGTLDVLSKIEGVQFIQNKSNLGYSGGNNIGMKQALKDGCELIFLLNSDAYIEKDAITNLVNALGGQSAGIAGPKIYFEGTKKLWFAGGIFDLANVLGKHRGVDEVDKGQFDQIEEIDYATGAAMLISKDVIDKIGLLDEQYFLYYEDSDYCFRARQVGIKIVYVPSAVVYHENAQSTGLGSPRQDYYITRNRMLFASKFLPLRTRFALFREAIRNLNQPVRRKALVDFLIHRTGKGID